MAGIKKSYKTAFIRISASNNTKAGLVEYTLGDIEKLLKEWGSSCKLTYWAIGHNNESDDPNLHYHIAIKFSNPMPGEQLKIKFPYGDIEPAGNIRNCVQYLIHLNDPSKKQYAWADIITNCNDMSPYKIRTGSQHEVAIMPYLERIHNGEIKEYNCTELIPWELRIQPKNKVIINNALIDYIEEFCMEKNRDIEVILISGLPGMGKTMYAKMICLSRNKKFCVSSSSNDPLQDYKGEPALILDDLTDKEFSFKDFMKLTDNHTRSTAKSRYRNKAFLGDLIIITTTKDINEWYFNDENSKNKHELRRRIPTMFKVSKDDIDMYGYNPKTCVYDYKLTVDNPFTKPDEEMLEKAEEFVSAMGLKIKRVNKPVEKNK